MAEKKEEADSAEASESEASPKASKLPLILGLLNTVLVLAVVGAAVYTRILYKRPAITEDTERERLVSQKKNAEPEAIPGALTFEPFTANIEPYPAKPKPADGTEAQLQGKMHYVYLGFSIEVRDMNRREEIESLRPILSDGILAILGKKTFADLTTVQGRYVLKTQMLELANNLWSKKESRAAAAAGQEPLFSNIYFTHFIVQ